MLLLPQSHEDILYGNGWKTTFYYSSFYCSLIKTTKKVCAPLVLLEYNTSFNFGMVGLLTIDNVTYQFYNFEKSKLWKLDERMQFFILLKFKIFILLNNVPRLPKLKRPLIVLWPKTQTLTIKILQLIQLSYSCRTWCCSEISWNGYILQNIAFSHI